MEKRCPTCNRRYVEEDLNYCLADGSFLLTASETSPPEAPPTIAVADAPTEVMPRGQLPTEFMPITTPAALPVYQRASSPIRIFRSHLWLIAFLVVCLVAISSALFLMLSWRNPTYDIRPRASGLSVEGTTWKGVDGAGDVTIEFLSNSQVRYKSNLTVMTTEGDRWSQKGDVVTLILNGGYATHLGTIRGNQMEIQARTKDDYTWNYTVTRIR